MTEPLTSKDAAKALGIPEQSIRRYARQGKIKSSKIGGSWKFKLSDIEDFWEENSNKK